MADEEKTPEKSFEGEAAKVSAKGGLFSPKNLGILAGLVLVLAVMAFFGIKALTGSDPEGGAVKAAAKAAPGKIISFPALVVNIAGTQGTRYLRTEVSIEISDQKGLDQEITQRMAHLTDILVTLFGGVTLEDADDPGAKNRLKYRIREQFNEVLAIGEVRNVYFREYVVQ